MKKLSIEQKAKAYDEALERAKSMIDDLRKGEDILAVSDLEEMFPELKEESEDDRIRKNLIELFHDTVSNDEMQPFNSVIDMGKNKPITYEWR